jgi:hypothetical protein
MSTCETKVGLLTNDELKEVATYAEKLGFKTDIVGDIKATFTVCLHESFGYRDELNVYYDSCKYIAKKDYATVSIGIPLCIAGLDLMSEIIEHMNNAYKLMGM